MDPKLDLNSLLTEQSNPASRDLDTLSTADLLGVLNREDQTVPDAVRLVLPEITRAVDAIVERMQAGGRLFYAGAGTSGRLGVLDASECPPTYNVPPGLVVGLIAGGETALRNAVEGAEDDATAGANELSEHHFGENDSLVGIASSGRTPYVIGALDAATSLKGLTIALACSPSSEISRHASIAIEVLTGPEVVTGSTRMKAGTATKLILNMISTAVMVRLGHVYSNLMVNVQPTNEKLVDRACRIIMEISGVSREQAARLLMESGKDVRVAVVMAKRGVPADAARKALGEVGWRLRAAIR